MIQVSRYNCAWWTLNQGELGLIHDNVFLVFPVKMK